MTSAIATNEAAVNFDPLAVAILASEDPQRRLYVRYPQELAACLFLELRPSERFCLAELVRYCDDEGKCWPSCRELARTIPRSGLGKDGQRRHYALVTIRVVMRRLAKAGLLLWDRVWPFGRFPSRKPGVPGRWTARGGRVWRPNLEALRKLAGGGRNRSLRKSTIDKLSSAAAPPDPPPPAIVTAPGETEKEQAMTSVLAPWDSSQARRDLERLGLVPPKTSGDT